MRCWGSPWRTSVVLVHLPSSRLARQAFFAERSWAKAGAQVGMVRATMSSCSTCSEAPNLTVWPRNGVSTRTEPRLRRVERGGAGRVERRAGGEVTKKPLKKARWRLVGWARVSVQALTRPSRGTRKGSCDWSVATWKPVTLPAAWQGGAGQEGSGTVAVLPRTTVARESVAAPAPAARTTRGARQPARAAASVNLPVAAIRPSAPALCEYLDMLAPL